MKINPAFFASIFIYIGLPASFAASALHQPSAQPVGSDIPWLFENHSEFILPLLFVAAVMSVASILVHHLHEEQRLRTFADIYLRSSIRPQTISAASKNLPKARLVKTGAL